MDKPDITIIAYRGDRAACWFYRLHAPLIHLAKNNKKKFGITVSSSIGKDHVGKYDIAILQRQYKPDVLMPILEMKKKGTKLIYEIDDDLFHIPKWNPAHKILGAKSVQDGMKKFLSEVDALFVTTEDLKDVYSDYCSNVYVLPNSIEFEFVYPGEKNTTLPVVCWQGSMTHEKDLEIARKGFEQLARSPDLIFKMWCGYKQNTKEPIFNIPGASTLPLTPFEGFFQMFGQVGTHIGLAPLAANRFNRSKSNLKFLEYTAYNAVTVASAFGPYKETIEDGVTGVLVENNNAWTDAVHWLLDEPDQYDTILQNAKALVEEKYNISKNYVLWQTAFEEVLGEKR